MLLYHLVFFNTFEELKLPMKGPMEDAGVINLYERSLLHVSKGLQSRTLLAESPFSRWFWRATQLRQFLIATAQGFRLPNGLCQLSGGGWQAWPSGSNVYEVSCGSLDGASRDCVDSMWRKQLRDSDRRLPKMKGSSVDWILVDNRRQKGTWLWANHGCEHIN